MKTRFDSSDFSWEYKKIRGGRHVGCYICTESEWSDIASYNVKPPSQIYILSEETGIIRKFSYKGAYSKYVLYKDSGDIRIRLCKQ